MLGWGPDERETLRRKTKVALVKRDETKGQKRQKSSKWKGRGPTLRSINQSPSDRTDGRAFLDDLCSKQPLAHVIIIIITASFDTLPRRTRKQRRNILRFWERFQSIVVPDNDIVNILLLIHFRLCNITP
ncbi:hypothetical protein GWI33_011966 [Rhynchophorus ferrugineus]|uniref:Uncharacterized protein n=1 Tax=Rhynchophorus ferrugineus TaxID=354439 RepID=A0A834IWG8_RHYFE|nr:hypothetical protein GWI33_011966 [Rhynchophorus ferrugineus]